MAEKYLLRVTAGPSYDPSTHFEVPVNTNKATTFSNPHATTSLQVRIQNYRGLPRNSPETSPYFSAPPHESDQYSISFAFAPKYDVPAGNLVFGNDFDRPIRDRLPPGFNTAFRIVTWTIDPGLEGDVYADEPYLYGPALSSLNVLRAGDKVGKQDGKPGEGLDLGKAAEGSDEGLEEGADQGAEEWRAETGAPEDKAARKKWGLDKVGREKWVWEQGRVFKGDFFNPYLDFNQFALKLPGGFHLGILGYMDGRDSLRYVLKDKETGHVFLVVVFTMHLKEDIEKEESAKGGKEESKGDEPGPDDLD